MMCTTAAKRLIAVLMSILVVFAARASDRRAVALGGSPMNTPQDSVQAPEFPEGLEWLNTGRPLKLTDLRGKVVLLDFWTYCCINCMHVIPDLKRLEEKYPNELVVIGVHSAKFTTEQETANIRQAILRYELRHPVVNDNRMVVWNLYRVRAWPTLVLIDPAGQIVGARSGENVFDVLDAAIGKLVKTFDADGRLDRRAMNLRPESRAAPESLLAFPGKVLADEAGGRLLVADSNHNRIVVLSLPAAGQAPAGQAEAAVRDVIGSGREGLKDGPADAAEFNHPQGMAIDGDVLYVADTENHALRRVDLKARTVTTIADTGKQARRFNVAGAGPTTPLNSPWDLLLHKGTLYVAMAGFHQVWRMDLGKGHVAPYAGSGSEARVDGPLAAAAFAQPSGLATDGQRLFVADSEVSSLRAVDLDGAGRGEPAELRVDTLAGGDLFVFGDRDGQGGDVRLQHPLGVAWAGGTLYVADTYNNKIKRVRPEDKTTASWLGSGKEGLADGVGPAATFNEPGGASVAGGRLYVADTNNHAIRVADLATGRVETLRIGAVEKLRPAAAAAAFAGETVRRPPVKIAPGRAALAVTLDLPAGYKLNPLAPSAVVLRSGDKAAVAFDGAAEKTIAPPAFPLRIDLAAGQGKADVTAEFTLYYCATESESVCLFKEVRVVVPVEVAEGGATEATVGYALPAPGK